jgi:hypothetical protein
VLPLTDLEGRTDHPYVAALFLPRFADGIISLLRC